MRTTKGKAFGHTVVETKEGFEIVLNALPGHSVRVNVHLLVDHLNVRITIMLA